MAGSPVDIASRAPNAWESLDFEAPYVLEKLVKDRQAASMRDAAALFTEVKRYLVLCQSDTSKAWQMHSLRVDQAWHQFILFTKEYRAFCHRYFGRYLHHAPSNAPRQQSGRTVPQSTFPEFRRRYQELFGDPPPDAWHDDRLLTLEQNLINDHLDELELRHAGDMVDVVDGEGNAVFGVTDLAGEAMEFVCRTGSFYVRELPGDLTDDEKLGLASGLVGCRLLRLGG